MRKGLSRIAFPLGCVHETRFSPLSCRSVFVKASKLRCGATKVSSGHKMSARNVSAFLSLTEAYRNGQGRIKGSTHLSAVRENTGKLITPILSLTIDLRSYSWMERSTRATSFAAEMGRGWETASPRSRAHSIWRVLNAALSSRYVAFYRFIIHTPHQTGFGLPSIHAQS